VATCPLATPNKWNPFRWWASVRRLRSLLKRERIELIHSNQLFSYKAVGTAARSLGIPRVCHLRNEMTPEGVRWWCSAGAEGVVCISRYIETQLTASWPSDFQLPRILSILNAIHIPERETSAQREEGMKAARRHWGVETKGVVFGFLGQIIPVKGLVELLAALGSLPATAEWTLLVAGRDPSAGAPHETFCHQYVEQRGLRERVKFLGYVDDVAKVYRAIDMAVVPSLEEPLGRIPLEAASYARPALASAVGGLPETIREGETGWLVQAGNVPELARAIRCCLDAPLAKYGQNARDWVETVSDPARYAQTVVQFYDELLENRVSSTAKQPVRTPTGCQS
jgi:glycosyltransferase involved in cell wall biosynthesis